MGSETYFATVAQVLPTLLIAFTIELGLIQRALIRADEATKEWPLGFGAAFSLTFLVGEVTAGLALGFGWFNAWTFSIVGIAALLLVLAVAWTPLQRLAWDLDFTDGQ